MIILGIETSCDETAASIVASNPAAQGWGGRVLANIVLSQLDDHRPYGGVVPEIAARSHLAHLGNIIDTALAEAGIDLDDLDAVAATAGPGLIGGVMVGVTAAKAIALARGLPFVAVNHLEAHALTARLGADVRFPYLLLLVSGGHCQILAVRGVGEYALYGSTLDDAVGEAFDKIAKLLGLGYPGGPALERAARDGVPGQLHLPAPMIGRPDCNFSFSGLKTAVINSLRSHWPEGSASMGPQDRADMAHAFQQAVCQSIEDRMARAMVQFRADFPEMGQPHLVVAGGVAANLVLRAMLDGLAARQGFQLEAPPVALCTDNAAMVAWAGIERFRLGASDSWDFAPRPRWPLATLEAPKENL